MINMYTSYTNSIFAQVTRGTVFQNFTAEEWKYYYLCFQSAQQNAPCKSRMFAHIAT
jgi:hypothetical protein